MRPPFTFILVLSTVLFFGSGTKKNPQLGSCSNPIKIYLASTGDLKIMRTHLI